MQEANFSNTSIISQKSLNTSAPNMNAPHKLLDNKEFSIMLPKATKKPLLDSIATLKSSYITFHSKLLQRSQSYEELSNSSRVQEPKKDKNQSNGNINEKNQMIAETRSLNERSAQPDAQKTSTHVPEGQREQNGSVAKEERNSRGDLPEKEVSVLIQNSGLIKKEISMINQDETLKNFIDELEFSHNDDNADGPSESHHHEREEDLKQKVKESQKSNGGNSVKENSKEISKESVRSIAESLQEKEVGAKRPFWGGVNKLSFVINLLLISMVFMAQKVKFSDLFASNMREPLVEEVIPERNSLMEEVKNETVVTVEVMKDVREYQEYQEMRVQKEKFEKENRDLKFKAESLEKELAELSEKYAALKSVHMRTVERISSVRDRLEQGKENMDKVKDNNVAAICSRYLGVIGAQLFGKVVS